MTRRRRLTSPVMAGRRGGGGGRRRGGRASGGDGQQPSLSLNIYRFEEGRALRPLCAEVHLAERPRGGVRPGLGGAAAASRGERGSLPS